MAVPKWQDFYKTFQAGHQAQFGQDMNRPWTADADSAAAKQSIDNQYLQALADYNAKNGTNEQPDKSVLGVNAQPNTFTPTDHSNDGFFGPLAKTLGMDTNTFGTLAALALGGYGLFSSGALGGAAAGSGMSAGAADAALAAFDASQMGTAFAAGSGMSAGAADAALAAFDASQMGTALPELAAIGGESVAGLGGLEAGGLGAFPSAMGTETGFGMGFGSAGAGAGIEGYGGVTGLLAPGGSAIGSSSMIDKAGQFIKDNPTLAKIGGAAVGAFANSKDTKNTNTQSTDPWAPAQPYLLDNLKTNAAMQEHYRANPFSNEQKTAYQGLLNTVANNSANAAPMMANANSFMQSSRGRTPAMQGLLSGTQAAPIDWNAYANIGRK